MNNANFITAVIRKLRKVYIKYPLGSWRILKGTISQVINGVNMPFWRHPVSVLVEEMILS